MQQIDTTQRIGNQIEAIFNNALAHAKIGDMLEYLLLLINILEIGDNEDEIVLQASEMLKEMDEDIQKTYETDLYSFIKNTKRFGFAQEKMALKKWRSKNGRWLFLYLKVC